MVLALWLLLPAWAIPTQGQELFRGSPDLAITQVESIYVKGLNYLAKSQTEEGWWSDGPYGRQTGVVGLAIVSILAHGDDPNTGPYHENIHRGIDFILQRMLQDNGYIGRSMYNHGFATLALAEAYGAVDRSDLGPALEKAVRLILNVQQRNPKGAWRYSPESKDADTTVTGAQLVALFAARNAGLAVPEEAFDKGIEFLLSCQTEKGGFGYTSAKSPNAPRTAIGCLILALAKKKQSPQFKSAFAYLQIAPQQRNYLNYFRYYASQTFFHASESSWQRWNASNIRELKETQNEDGSWTGQFGNTFATSACLLSLALNYRFLPIYER